MTLVGVDLWTRFYDPRPVLLVWGLSLLTLAAITLISQRLYRTPGDWLIVLGLVLFFGPPHLIHLVQKRFVAELQEDGQVVAEEGLWFGPIPYQRGEVAVPKSASLRMARVERFTRYATRESISSRRWLELPHVILCFTLLSCVVTPLLAGFFMRFFVPSWRLASVGSGENELPFDVRLVGGSRDSRTVARELIKGDAVAAAQALHALLGLELKVDSYRPDERPPRMKGRWV